MKTFICSFAALFYSLLFRKINEREFNNFSNKNKTDIFQLKKEAKTQRKLEETGFSNELDAF